MSEIRQQLSKYPVRTRLSLTGTLVVARDIAHAKLQVGAVARTCVVVWGRVGVRGASRPM